MKVTQEDTRKRVKRLFILWMVSAGVYYTSLVAVSIFLYFTGKLDSKPAAIIFVAVCVCLLLFYFLPLIRHVKCEAARIKMKGILIPARIIYIVLLAIIITLAFAAAAFVLSPMQN